MNDDCWNHVAAFLRAQDGTMLAPTCRRLWDLFATRRRKLLPPTFRSYQVGDRVHSRRIIAGFVGTVEGHTRHFLRIYTRGMGPTVCKPASVCRIIAYPDPTYVKDCWRCRALKQRFF